MSGQNLPEQNSNSSSETPPSGDSNQAEPYINQLIDLINTDRLPVLDTDLSRFDPTSLQKHYRLHLRDYEVEISHNKHPDSGKDFYTILFNNLKQVNQQCSEKVILAYMHLTENQFRIFKSAVERQVERKKKAEEEKRLKQAMVPIDRILEQLNSSGPKEDGILSIPLRA